MVPLPSPGELRVVCLWCPDWSIFALQHAHGIDPEQPLALLHKGKVAACSASARACGVSVGLRKREAQARCPDLDLHPHDAEFDADQFAPVLDAIDAVTPGVCSPRPGTALLRATGATRYYGSEKDVATVVLAAAASAGLTHAQVGIADDVFTAEQAARAEHTTIVPPGGSADYLAPIDVEALGEPRLTVLLRRLGVSTLGQIAAMPRDAMRERFGDAGHTAHRRACGEDPTLITPRPSPRHYHRRIEVDPPLADTELLIDTATPTITAIVTELTEHWQACLDVTITLTTDAGRVNQHTWRHPQWFTADDLIERLRWQLTQWTRAMASDTSDTVDSTIDGISWITIDPIRIGAVADHDAALLSKGPDRTIRRAVSDLQNTLGPGAVGTPVLIGGRAPADRHTVVTWGEAGPPPAVRDRRTRAWPGHLPEPAPTQVFTTPIPCQLYAATHQPVEVTERGTLSGAPQWLAPGIPAQRVPTHSPSADLRELTTWSGPWPLDERWWEPGSSPAQRIQAQCVDGIGWLLLHRDGHWFIEARYD